MHLNILPSIRSLLEKVPVKNSITNKCYNSGDTYTPSETNNIQNKNKAKQMIRLFIYYYLNVNDGTALLTA